MNKKGFTLIELLTSIAILSILLVMSIPKINTAFRESKADQMEDIRKTIVQATDVFLNNSCGQSSYESLNKNKEVRIYLNVIMQCGFIEDTIYNPVSGKYFDIDDEYIIVRKDEIGMINYELSF